MWGERRDAEWGDGAESVRKAWTWMAARDRVKRPQMGGPRKPQCER